MKPEDFRMLCASYDMWLAELENLYRSRNAYRICQKNVPAIRYDRISESRGEYDPLHFTDKLDLTELRINEIQKKLQTIDSLFEKMSAMGDAYMIRSCLLKRCRIKEAALEMGISEQALYHRIRRGIEYVCKDEEIS